MAALVLAFGVPAVVSAQDAPQQEEPRVLFSPGQTASRAEIVTFLYRGFLLAYPDYQPYTDVEAVFADVPADAYYADAVAWAWEMDVTYGTGYETLD